MDQSERSRTRRSGGSPRVGSLGPVIVLAVAACGGGEPETAPDAPARDQAAAPGAAASGGAACEAFDEELLTRVGLGFQLVRQMSTPRQMESMEATVGLPEPESFRALADALGRLDTSGVDPLGFMPLDSVTVDVRRLADLLEAALAADEADADGHRARLTAFADEMAAPAQASMGYHLDQLGCVD